MSKQDWNVVRDVGRAIAAITVAHGLTTKQWSEWHSVGMTFWVVGETGSMLS